ncbi:MULTISPECIES: cupin domain-containing protein [Streptacidiphilus]|uniref:Cupin domain-containing protein n=1 Tax=Streptacidiphilus cavernicola TaxID=3342716 RepID=A0ABV6UM93_9ACTN|nr:cupin domain-containing protein [Streptacidiphilus jeojiense]
MSDGLDLKRALEFLAVESLPWSDAPGSPGVSERVLSAAPSGDGDVLTRLARWAPGLDTSAAGVIRHRYCEEVLILEGELEDLTLGTVFTAGHYACRPPGMPHGPYRTTTGCVMLEIRYRPR